HGVRGHDDAAPQLVEMVDEVDPTAVRKPLRKPHGHATLCRSSVCSSTALCGGSSLATSTLCASPLIEFLNSRMPLPSPRPISGSRFGPNRTRQTSASRTSSGKPMKPGIQISFRMRAGAPDDSAPDTPLRSRGSGSADDEAGGL